MNDNVIDFASRAEMRPGPFKPGSIVRRIRGPGDNMLVVRCFQDETVILWFDFDSGQHGQPRLAPIATRDLVGVLDNGRFIE
jgi:hypothetical protein